ncbi:MAG: SRPBCC family protein [Cyclobacteriaceae bacterium]
MPVITLDTIISAPPERCFDLSRSIDLHEESTGQTDEQAIDGVTSGLIGPGEFVTWRARHFGIYQTLTSRITGFDRPRTFTDEMVEGAFAGFVHTHSFVPQDGQTLMRDEFDYTSPLGPLGRLADWLFLKRHMRQLLETRIAVIKEVAESDRYHAFLP